MILINDNRLSNLDDPSGFTMCKLWYLNKVFHFTIDKSLNNPERVSELFSTHFECEVVRPYKHCSSDQFEILILEDFDIRRYYFGGDGKGHITYNPGGVTDLETKYKDYSVNLVGKVFLTKKEN